MNLYFIPGEGRRDYPRRSYARIDQVEPINIESTDEIVFGFDAVDATWPGFLRGKILSLDPSDKGYRRSALFWENRFSGRPPEPGELFDPYDEVPLYQIELTLRKASDWLENLTLDTAQWFEIDLYDSGAIPVDVFGGLFQAAVTAYMRHPPRPMGQPAALNDSFDMDLWPDATDGELKSALNQQCSIEQLSVFDVGQGSANALICTCGFPVYYYDVGCGVYRNTNTNPSFISFCTCDRPPVILSHWDSDHWAGAIKDASLQSLTWIAPRQQIGPKHTTFGNGILKAGGSILIVPTATTRFAWGVKQHFELRRCTGSVSDRNGTGLALVVKDVESGREWLLTGDAAYNLIPGPLPANLAAVVVPHHGADMGSASIPPTRSAHSYSRLLYSFGPGNAHGKTSVHHPTFAAMNAHIAASWPHGAWLPASPGMALAGQPLLATASNMATHQGGAAAGWSSAPSAPQHLTRCKKAMPISQT